MKVYLIVSFSDNGYIYGTEVALSPEAAERWVESHIKQEEAYAERRTEQGMGYTRDKMSAIPRWISRHGISLIEIRERNTVEDAVCTEKQP